MQFKYNFLTLIRSKSYVFFALVFPLLLGTFFNLAFGDLELAEFNPIPVAVMQEDHTAQPMFADVLRSLGTGEDAILEIIPAASMEEAEELLLSGEIYGVFALDAEAELVVSRSGMNQSILQSISNEFLRRSAVIGDVAMESPEMAEAVLAQMETGLTINQDAAGFDTNFIIYMFYALLAMVCFMGSQVGFQVATEVQAQLSPLAARRTIAPTRKWSVVVNGFLSAILFHFIMTAIIMAYLIFILRVNFGQQLPFVLLACLVGTLTGVSYGMLIATVVKAKTNVKEAIMTGSSFVFWAASGLFAVDIRRAVRNAAPLLDRLNPTTLMSDAFATLVVHDHLGHYVQSLLILLAMSAVFLLVSAAALRGGHYAES